MNKQVSLLFALLRNALFLQPFNIDDWKNVDWAELYKLIKSHALQTLVAEPVMMLPVELRPSAQIQSDLLQLMAMNMAEHARLNADICKVFQLLTERGFHPVLLKGQGIATFYPKPLARKCGDVDIYIGEKDYDAACKFLINDVEGTTGKHESEKHYEIFYGKTELEIHRFAEIVTHPQNNGNYQKLTDFYFSCPDDVVMVEHTIPIPPHQYLPVYVFNHLWHHLKKGGVGIRQFCDLAAILHSLDGKIDLAKLKSDLIAVNLLSEWQLVGSLVVDFLGLPAKEYPFYCKQNRIKQSALLKLVVEDGNFAVNRHYYYKTNYLFVKKARSFFIYIPRYWCMFKMNPKMTFSIIKSAFKTGISEVLSR